MPRSATSIQTEITSIEAQLANAASAQSMSADGVSITQQSYASMSRRLNYLYALLDRVNGAPMVVRGVVKGLRG